MELGISTHTYAWAIGVTGYAPPINPMGAFELLETARKQNISLIQFADNLPLHQLSDAELNKLNEVARKWKICLQVGIRGTSPDMLQTYLELALRFSSPIVRAIITDSDIQLGESNIAQVLKNYEQQKVILAIENHGLQTTEQLIGLFKRLDSPSIGCCLDTVNSFSALEAPDKVIRDLSPYAVCLHVKDFEIKRIDHQMGFVITGTPAGSGRLDIDFAINSLADRSENMGAILELWTPFTNTIEETIKLEANWAQQSLKYLRQKLNRIP